MSWRQRRPAACVSTFPCSPVHLTLTRHCEHSVLERCGCIDAYWLMNQHRYWEHWVSPQGLGTICVSASETWHHVANSVGPCFCELVLAEFPEAWRACQSCSWWEGRQQWSHEGMWEGRITFVLHLFFFFGSFWVWAHSEDALFFQAALSELFGACRTILTISGVVRSSIKWWEFKLRDTRIWKSHGVIHMAKWRKNLADTWSDSRIRPETEVNRIFANAGIQRLHLRVLLIFFKRLERCLSLKRVVGSSVASAQVVKYRGWDWLTLNQGCYDAGVRESEGFRRANNMRRRSWEDLFINGRCQAWRTRHGKEDHRLLMRSLSVQCV